MLNSPFYMVHPHPHTPVEFGEGRRGSAGVRRQGWLGTFGSAPVAFLFQLLIAYAKLLLKCKDKSLNIFEKYYF